MWDFTNTKHVKFTTTILCNLHKYLFQVGIEFTTSTQYLVLATITTNLYKYLQKEVNTLCSLLTNLFSMKKSVDKVGSKNQTTLEGVAVSKDPLHNGKY